MNSKTIIPAKLTAKQQCFVVEYMVDLNATKAAERAGYSKKTARVIGAENLTKPAIVQALEAKQSKRLQKREITAERVLDEIYKMAMLDPRKLFTTGGYLIPVHELDDDTAASIAGIEVSELFEHEGKDKKFTGLLKKIKIADKYRGLDLLGRHLRLFGSEDSRGLDDGQMGLLIDAIERS